MCHHSPPRMSSVYSQYQFPEPAPGTLQAVLAADEAGLLTCNSQCLQPVDLAEVLQTLFGHFIAV